MNISLLLLSAVILQVDSARILAVFPTPSISHQVVFRPLISELVNLGHAVVLVTTDPMYPKGDGPKNLKEIDMHDISYRPWVDYIPKETEVFMEPTVEYDIKGLAKMLTVLFINISKEHLISEPIQKLINDKTQHFDLLLIEAYQRSALVYTHIFKAPVIQVSSFGSLPYNMETVGAPVHPILFPNIYSRKINNFTSYERLLELYNFVVRQYITYSYEKEENEMLSKAVGPSIPSVSELTNNVDMLFLNVHPIWEFNRPVPPNVIFLGAMHIKPEKVLSKDLKSYLNSSENGVIYMSFGTNVDPSTFPPGSVETFVKVFAELPYDILWKWHTEDVPSLPKNVRLSKWFPQRDLLMHPNIKLFITQGGLQSTDETILAGVPVVGIPMVGDQWYDVDRYVDLGIGVRIDIMTMDDDVFRNAITTVINDKSYKENIVNLRTIMYDQPQSALERAVWWTEYVLRHGGARHLRAAGANLSWAAYYELELVTYLLAFLVVSSVVSVLLIYFAVKFVLRLIFSERKFKKN